MIELALELGGGQVVFDDRWRMDLRVGFRSITSRVAMYHPGTTGMGWCKLGDIPNLVVYHDPAIGGRIVLGNLPCGQNSGRHSKDRKEARNESSDGKSFKGYRNSKH